MKKYVLLVGMFMIPNKVTPILELKRALLLKNYQMTGFVQSVALLNQCL